MRKARNWFTGQFWPRSADDIISVTSNFSLPENAWFRQVLTYWEMASVLVLQGALNENLFFGVSAEMWFCFAKLYPYLKAYREKTGLAEIWKNIETLATRTKQGRTRLEKLVKRVTALGEQMNKAKG
jgi:hypothetical protein